MKNLGKLSKKFSIYGVLLAVAFAAVTLPPPYAFAAAKMNSGAFSDMCRTAPVSDIRAAIDAGTKFDEDALFKAATTNSDPNVIKLLVEAAKKFGKDIINAKDFDGVTALLKAAGSNPNPSVVQALIDCGADVNARDNFGRGAIYRAKMNLYRWRRRRNSALSIINMLVKAGARDEKI